MNTYWIQRIVFAVCSIFLISILPVNAQVVINEIDYDQPGTDEFEFIELLNTGGSTVSLDTFYLELYNSGTESVYNLIELPDSLLAPGEYFVICGNASNVTTCNFEATPGTDLIQNGPADAAALFHVAGDTTVVAVTDDGFNTAYVFGGFASNPDVPVRRGETYVVDLTAPGHPFWVKTAPTTGTGDQYNDGVTNNGIDDGLITFTIPFDAPDTLYYQCEFHSPMGGMLLVSNTYSDAVSYDGDAGAPYVEGTAFSGADNNTDDYLGVSRFPDGADTDDNDADFSLRCITPGAANSSDNTGCANPYQTVCEAPDTVYFDNITTTSATAYWDPANSGSAGYLLEIVLENDPPAGNYQAYTDTFASLPPGAGMLPSGTTFDVYIVEVCSSAPGDTSAVAGPFQFTTLSECDEPTTLSSQDVTSDEATLFWTSGGGLNADSYIVEYGQTGFTPGTGAFETPTDTFANLTGLNANTDYDFYVTQVCGTNPGDTSVAVGAQSFTTLCNVFGFPFLEDFESGSSSLSCWSQDVVGAGWQITSNQANSGSQSYYHNDDSGAQSDRLISPAIDLTGAVNPQLVFWEYDNFSSFYDNHEVAISTDGGSTWSAPIYNQAGVEDTWTEVVLDVSAYAGQTIHVGFLYEGDFSDEWYIDDFELREAPTCVAPTALSAQNISVDEATAIWTAGIGAVSYIVEFDTVGFNTGEGTLVAVNDTFAVLSGLDANTDYEFYVSQVCGTNPGDTTTAAGPEAFTTQCAALMAPYSENFDTTGGTVIPDNGPLPDCWTGIVVDASGTATLEVDIAGDNGGSPSPAISSPNIIELTTDDAGDTVVLVSPAFSDLGAQDKRIRFYAQRDDHLGDLFIGTMTDANDLSTFMPYDTILNSELLDGTWAEFTVNFDTYAGGTAHIAFMQIEPNPFSDTYIDNFVYEKIPSCFAPTALSSQGITESEASVYWTSASGAASFIVEYDTAGFTPGSGNIMTPTDTFVNLSGLDANTAYDFYVTQVCGTNPGDTSAVAGPVSFTTECEAVASFPWTETFENSSTTRSCWANIYESGTADWTYDIGSSGGAISAPFAGALNARFVSQSGTNNPATKLVSPVLDLSGLTNPEVEFYYGQEEWFGDQNTLHVFYRVSPSDPWVLIADYTSEAAVWTQETLLLPNPSSTYQLAFEGRNNYGRANVLDNVTVQAGPSCPPVTDLTVSNITASEATLSWTPSNSDTSYLVAYDTTGAAFEDMNNVFATSNASLNISGLDASTEYDFYVVGVCGTNVGDSTLVGPETFTTTAACDVPTALSTQNISSDEATATWTAGTGAVSYIVEYDTAGFTPGDGNVLTPTDTFVNLTGLDALTEYEFYVTQVCGTNPGDTTAAVGPETFATLCAAVMAPYQENFDGSSWTPGTGFDNSGDAIDPCWSRNPATSSDFFWGTRTGTTGSGSTGPDSDNTTGSGNYIFTEGSNGGTGDIATITSPQIDLSSLTVPQLLFAYHFYGANTDSFWVEVYDGTVWTLIDTITGTQQTDNSDPWLIRELDLSAFAGSTVQVRFSAIRGTSFNADYALDDIWIRETPSCIVPSSLAAQDITETEATLFWTASPGAASFIVEYDTAGFTPGDGNVLTPTDTFVNLTGLSASTDYEFYVTQVCGANPGDTSFVVGPESFRTACGVELAPFFENFDGAVWVAGSGFNNAGSEIDPCWTSNPPLSPDYYWGVGEGTTGTSFSTGPDGDNTTGIGNYVFTESSNGSTGDIATFTSPQIDLSPLTVPQLLYAYHFYGATIDTFLVSVDDGNGYVFIDTIIGEQQADNPEPWLIRELDLSAFAGATVNVRFTARKGGTSCDYAIDDFWIRETPSCNVPTALSSQDITENSATVSWTGTSGAVSYILEYDTAGFTPGDGNFITPTDTFSNLTGLMSNTEYDFYVTQACGTNPGDTSLQVGPATFTTSCNAFTAPYSENFDSIAGVVIPDNGPLPDCWTGIVVDASGTATLEVDAANNSGAPSDPISEPNFIEITTDDVGDTVVLVSPAFSDLGAQDKRIRFYAQRDDHAGDLFIGTMTDANDLSTFMPYDTILNSELLDGTWAEFTVNFDTYIGGTAHIAFMQIEPNAFSDTYIDNFVYEEIPSCFAPTALSSQGITESEATIYWTSATGAASFIVEYDTAGFTPGNGNIMTPTDTFVNLSGLNENTAYEFYVTQACSANPGDTSTASGPVAFTTQCAAVLAPYQEDFEGSSWVSGTGFSNTGDAIDPCWSRNPATSSDYFWGTRTGTTGSSSTGPSSDNTTGSGKYVFAEGSNGSTGAIATITTPPIDLSPLTTPELLFAYHIYGSGTDSFWVEINDGLGWVQIDAITGAQQSSSTDPWLIRTLNLSAYAGATVNVRFNGIKGGSFSDYAIDDVWIREAPSCAAVTDLTVEDVNATDATVSWTSASGAASFIVEYDTLGFTLGQGNLISTTDTFAVISGLTSATDYDIYVTQVCGTNPGDTSFVTGPVSITTLCVAPVISSYPYTENFDGVTSPDIPCGWIVENTNGDAYEWETYSGTLPSPNSSPNSIAIRWNGSQAMNDWIFSPELILTGGQSYDLSFAYTNNSSFYTEKLKVHYGTGQTSGDMTTQLFDDANVQYNGVYQTVTVSFTPPNTGSYYIGFHGYSDANQFRLAFDDFEIDLSYICSTVDAGMNDTICAGDTTTLTAVATSAVGTYSWSPGGASTASVDVAPTVTTDYIVTFTDTNNCVDSDTVTVVVDSLPNSVLTDRSVCSGSTITLDAGNPGSTYSWSTGESTQTIVATDADSLYTVTITTPAGCSITDTSQVTLVTDIPIGLMDYDICEGDTQVLDANNPGRDFMWSTGDTTQTISVTTSDIYYVTVTDPLVGCTGTDTSIVTVNPLPPADAGSNDTICLGESSTLTASGGVDYAWSTSDMTASTTVSPMATTDYYVTVTDANACSDTDTATVVVNPLPVVDAGMNDTICLGDSATLTASGADTYLWSTSEQTASITVNPTATSDFVVTGTENVNGCSASDTVTVLVNPLPPADAGSDVSICLGDSTTLMASGGTDFLWSTSDQTASITVSPTMDTQYSVEVTDNNSCSASDTVEVVVNALPPADAGQDEVICDGDSVTLTASGGTDYMWSTGDMTASITESPSVATEYGVLVTDTNGCFASDTVEVMVNPLPVASAGADTNVCEGSSVTLTASGGTVTGYQWSNGDMTENTSVSPSMDTTYSVTVTDGNGCTDVAFVDVEVLELPIVRFVQVDSSYCAGSGNVQLVASPPGGNFSGNGVSGTTLDLDAVGAGNTTTVTFTYQATNGCVNSTSMDIFVDPCPGIDEIDFLNQVQLMPNPFTDRLVMTFNSDKETKVLLSMMDISGRQIWVEDKVVQFGKNTFELNTGNQLAEGMYFVTISSAEQSRTFKVIKTVK